MELLPLKKIFAHYSILINSHCAGLGLQHSIEYSPGSKENNRVRYFGIGFFGRHCCYSCNYIVCQPINYELSVR